MGARGPLPTPIPILEARGSRHARKPRAEQLRPGVEMPTCPGWLRGEARREWHRLTEVLAALGLLAKADRGVLALLCSAWGDFCRATDYIAAAEAKLADGGSLYDAAEDAAARIRRAQRDARSAAELYAKLADRFGLCPSARQRIATPSNPAEPVDELEKFLEDGRNARINRQAAGR